MHNVIIVVIAIVMGLTPLPTVNQPPNITESTAPKISVVENKASAAEQPKEEAKPVEVKETTWQDNPQNCNQETQFISEQAPFNCIDKPAPAPVAAPAPTGTTSGNCYQWLLDAGVTDMASAVELQRRENGSCNPQLYNQGGSDACGVAQELPCGKSGCGMPPNADGACQIRWMNSYVLGRYGSWAAALQFHNAHNWY